MAGVYPDVPGHRFAYDVDGTLVKARGPALAWGTPTQADVQRINDEDSADWLAWATGGTWVGASGFFLNYNDDRTIGPSYLTFVFPQLRNLTGYFIFGEFRQSNQSYNPAELQVSTNTTDGSDGTWTTIVNPWVWSTPSAIPYMRSAIQPVTGADNIKGVRFAARKNGGNIDGNDAYRLFCLHMFGTIVGATNGLRFWHPTLDQEVGPAYFDYGDVPWGTAVTKQFRIKNTHGTLTANNVVLSAESNTGSDAGLASGLTFSQDNTTYATTQTVTSIAAGAISSILYARRTVGAAEAQQLRAARLKAVGTTWT